MSGRNQCLGDVSDDEIEAEVADDAGIDSDEEGGFRISADIYIPPPPPKHVSEAGENGPRLMITKIVNENFKSYAGEQVIGPFHQCFSAIIGPNGSGKSNVIDSMLFVFGYRASKIRSKKISVLIHNSSQHPDCRSCTVSVHFQKIIDKPGTNYDVVPNSAIIISRTAFKDNSSYYQLNGRKVQFKEIAKMLRGNGVDLDHNRFLILQGEVEQIAMMKPKGQTNTDTGMLEFLEDIIGTVRYKEPLEKLSNNVELLSERRVECLNRVRVVEKEKNDLQEPMQDAVEYLKCENSITILQHKLYYSKRFNAQEDYDYQEQKKIELDQDYAKLKEQMKLVKEEKEGKNLELQEKYKKWDKLQNKKDKLTANYEEAKKKDEQLHAEVVESNKTRKANIATLKQEQEKLEELARVPEKNMKDMKECEELYGTLTASREKEEAELETLVNGLKEKTEPLLEQRRQLESDLVALRKNVDSAKAKYETAQSSLQLYTSAEDLERKKLEELQDTLKNTIQTLQERKAQVKSLDAKIPATEKSLASAQKEMADLQKKELEAMNRLKDMRAQFEEQRSAMNANRSRNKVLNALMEEKRQGNIPGIYGRLGDLGAIDSKYDVAISTACGPLDNIVVDTVDTAQRCIGFLRKNDIGRATFIALEKQQKFQAQCAEKIRTPENVPRLFDLIKVEDKNILPAFYYGLRNTLVANNLDQATRIAYGAQRHRVVTLKGDLIEIAGTMSGGGKTVSRGRMGQSVVRAEPNVADIERLQVNLDSVYEECNRLKARHQELEPQIVSLTSSLRDMKMDKEKFTSEQQSLAKQEPFLKTQLLEQKKKAAEAVSDPKEVQRLTKVVDKAKIELTRFEDDSKAIENDVAAINGKIEDISGGRIKNKQKTISEIIKKADKAKGEICRLQVGIQTAERNTKKVEQHIERLEADIHKYENAIRQRQQERNELEEAAKTLLAELSEVTERLVERDADSASLKSEVDALEERQHKMKAVKIELDQKMAEITRNIDAFKSKIPEYTKRIAALKLHAIPGEPVKELSELSDEEIRELDEKAISKLLEKTKERLPEEIPNMQLIKEYQEKDALYMRRVADFEEITNERNKLRELYDECRRRRAQEFLSGFSLITGKLKEMYQMITLGGDAELELVDSLDPFSEGIVFSVRPPKKSWKNISNLSGGEKTLSSLALVFALHHYKPTPLYFMDEIDAALDFKNVSIVGNYIKERTKNAQFIVISLRSNMFELADYLVGIYKTYNCTKCATLDVAKYCSVNGILPASVVTNGKDRYGASQPSRMYGTSVLKPPKQNTIPVMRATCPAVILDSSANSLENVPEPSADLGLPELGLCPTPKKLSSGRKSSSTDPDDIVENSPSCQPRKKRRKL